MKKAKATQKQNGKGPGVLVTTEHKGVFFGYLVGEPSKERVELTRARMCVYWDASVKGVEGLAVTGPGRACKISQAVPTLTLYDITGVGVCTPEAIEAWERGPWA